MTRLLETKLGPRISRERNINVLIKPEQEIGRLGCKVLWDDGPYNIVTT